MKHGMISGRLSRFAVAAVAVAALLPGLLPAADTKEQIAAQQEGLELIRQVEEVARDVHYNAERLHSFAGSVPVSKWTHAHHLNQIKGLINEGLKPAFLRLEEIQNQLPAWKQESVDQMMMQAKNLAADTNAAMLTKPMVNLPAGNPEYLALIAKINGHAESLVKTSDAAGDYAAARLKAARNGVPVAPAKL